jgi:hypothetical protein
MWTIQGGLNYSRNWNERSLTLDARFSEIPAPD